MYACVCWKLFHSHSKWEIGGCGYAAGAGILNFPNIYVQQTPVSAPHYSVDNTRFWCRVSSVVHKRFLSRLSICSPNIYWPLIGIMYYCILNETSFKIALTVHLRSWRTGLKQINIQNLTRCVTSNKIYLYSFKYRLW